MHNTATAINGMLRDLAKEVVAQAKADGVDAAEVLTLLAEKYETQDVVAEIVLDALIGDSISPSEVIKALVSRAGRSRLWYVDPDGITVTYTKQQARNIANLILATLGEREKVQ